MPIRAVIFDFFDTLVDLHMENLPRLEIDGRVVPSTAAALHAKTAEYAGISFEAFVDALVGVDREFRRSHYAEGLELPTLERFGTLCERLAIDAAGLPAALTAVHMGKIREQVRVPPHHAKALAELGGRVQLALCSNFSHSETVHDVMREHGLDDVLDAIVISEDVGIRKPRPEIFESVLRALDVRPAEALHVGDNLSADVDGAAALGIRTVWITRRIEDSEGALRKHSGSPPDFRVGDLAEIEGLLDRVQ